MNLNIQSVIVNGLVEVVKPNGERVEYKLGDSFGAEPNPAVQYHVGEMRTMVDDCEFVLVEHKVRTSARLCPPLENISKKTVMG
ncbi:unnamed protein product [Cylicostephanus goldi]|uniref:Uncharacterized protein n=1 Tax=Cylicostephanus goldi TaxID=71465 RepID=A0A3P6RHF2_CYLGO|nr:unnamed protein product [Cylicostephanus goldi]